MSHLRVFIGLTEISGYNAGLKQGFEELGINCTFLNQHSHPFIYGGDESPHFLLHIQRRVNTRLDTTISRSVRILYQIIIQICNIPLFLRMLSNTDIFIFSYGSTFLGYYDLPILRFLKKRIIYIFFGSDERPPYLDGALMGTEKGRTIKECIRLTKKQKRKIRRIEKYADICISHPASAHFHSRRFIQWLAIGIPLIDHQNVDNIENDRNIKHIRILHAPSDPEAKGTELIRQAIRELEEKGYPVEYIEISGKPHAIVVQELKRCDFVIDQLYSDTPMAMFAAEAAVFGKPAIVGGYYAEQIHKTTPISLIPPSLYCHPNKIHEAIELLTINHTLRYDLGQEAQKYVQEFWTPSKVAKRYMHLIDNSVPDEWFYNPEDIRYLYGIGLSEANVRSLLQSLIDEGGIEALQISDKPELEDALLNLAYRI